MRKNYLLVRLPRGAVTSGVITGKLQEGRVGDNSHVVLCGDLCGCGATLFA